MSNIVENYADLLQEKHLTEDVLTSPYKWEPVDPSAIGEKKVLFGICRHCMQGDCSTLVHIEDGIVTKVEGNDIPPNYGSLCPRGNAAIMGLYNPYRVKTPLMRTNPEKGLDVDPKWKEITWDEALDITANELKKAFEYDPRSIVVNEGWGSKDTLLRPAFVKAFKTPNEVGSHGSLCAVHYGTGLIHGNFPVSLPDLEYCNYHITIGRSLGPNFATAHGSKRLAKALARGMKLVVVDPRCSHEASKGEWVPIRPGSDLAFLLGMAHVMFYEIDKLDWQFLKERTNARYLIRPDGYYARDKETNKPLVWDNTSQKAVPYDTKDIDSPLEGRFMVDGVEMATGYTLIKERFKEYTPEWAEELCTVPASTIRRIANEFVEHAQIGSTIEIDGVTLPFRPVSLNMERNVMSHRYGVYADLVGKLINMMVGAIEVPGACLGSGYRGESVLAPTEDGTMSPGSEAVPVPFKFPPDHIGMQEFFPHAHATPHIVTYAVENPEEFYLDYEIRVWLGVGVNMIRTNAQPERYVEMFKKIPFHADIVYHMDEQAVMADVLLPEHSFLERLRVMPFFPSHQSFDDTVTGLQMIQLRQPVPKLFNTMHVDHILMELAERAGRMYGEGGLLDCINKFDCHIIHDHGMHMREPYLLDLNTKYTYEEIIDRWLKSWKFNDEGKGFKELNEEGAFIKWQPKYTFYHYYHWPGDSTKHEFYFINLKKVGDSLKNNLRKYNIKFPMIDDEDYIFDLYDPVPHWVESSEWNAPEEYDLFAFNWKPPYVSSDVGNVIGNPWMAELYRKDPFEGAACLNPRTAAAKGLKDGDWVRISSRYGSIECPIITSERFHPDGIGISGTYGPGNVGSNPLNTKGPHFNRLIPTSIDTIDPVSASQEIAPKVKVEKIPKPTRS
ncbi:MAG: molybdopterin-dependent oxidoreductase [Clostridiales bacterium]|nr:molybdopterin-dependent oxidoreductase [Clostridiales bacterium]